MRARTISLELHPTVQAAQMREVAEFMVTSSGDTKASRREDSWKEGNDSLSRYGRMILGATKQRRVIDGRDRVETYTSALSWLFGTNKTSLYLLREDQEDIGIGSIILGQEIIDENLGQIGPQANIDYFLAGERSDAQHALAAEYLLAELLAIDPTQRAVRGAVKKYYAKKREGGGTLHRRGLAGFAAVVSGCDNPSKGFEEYERYISDRSIRYVRAVGSSDPYDLSFGDHPVEIYEAN